MIYCLNMGLVEVRFVMSDRYNQIVDSMLVSLCRQIADEMFVAL